MIDELTGVTSVKDKQSILAKYTQSPTIRKVWNYTLSPFITFGIKKFQLPNAPSATDQYESFDAFFEVLEQLRSRQVTGEAARNLVEGHLKAYTADTAEKLARIIRQDLKVNVGTSLLNKGEKFVDEFDVMLADKLSPKFKWNPPYFVEWKYDGMRLVAEWSASEPETIVYRSREGRIQNNVPDHITKRLCANARRYAVNAGVDGLMIDGEVYGNTYHETMSLMKNSDASLDRSSLNFFVFDMLNRDEWIAQHSNAAQMERRARVESFCGDDATIVMPSEGKMCATKDEANEYYLEMVDRGAEGAMLKDPKGKYAWKRSKAWTKWKPVFTADLTIVGMYEGDELKGFKGTLGGLTLSGHLEDGTYVEGDCGSGFPTLESSASDIRPTREELWNNQSKYIGMTVEVEYQEVTRAKTKDVDAIRFAVFKHLRFDK